MKKYNVAVVGATGLVGRTFVNILEERKFPIERLRLLASERSAGTTLRYGDQDIEVEALHEHAFEGIDFALFSAGASVSLKFAPIAAESGAIVIDNSSAFRMHEQVPLVVPEVNAHALRNHGGIIANPNCSTIQMVVAVNPIHRAATVKRIVVSTYQAVSGKGKEAVDALNSDAEAYLTDPNQFNPKQIAFNLCPQIDVFMEDASTKEETKMVMETRKIMGEPELSVSATCVRVPVMNGHSCSVNLELEQPLEPTTVKEILANSPGIVVMDEPERAMYPTPLHVSGKDEVFVGRIRRDPSLEHGLNLWIVADNLRKGAALNTIQIAECLI